MAAYIKKQVALKNGETLSYIETAGSEGANLQTLLFVHGNMSSSIHFKPILDRLPEGFKAYVPDLRGFGDSTYNQPVNSLADFAEDLHAFVVAMGLETFTLVGWSTGGGICMAYDLAHPGYAKGMVLIETVSYKGYPIFKKDAQGQAIVGEVYGSKEEMGQDPVQVLPAQQAFETGNLDYMNMIWDMAIYSVHKPSAEDNALYMSETMKQRNLVDVDWALATFNLSAEHNGYTAGDGTVSAIQIPVLAFWSDRDYVVLESMVTETVEAIGSNAKYVLLADSGHSPLIDCPETLSNHIFQFAQGL